MHGAIFMELKKYVDHKLGGDSWAQLLKAAGLAEQVYLPTEEYPDEEAVRLVSTASKITGLAAGTILEDFGKFIAPDLLAMYPMLIKPGWKTLDVIENTEETIHKVVRARNPGAAPPELVVERHDAGSLSIYYTSQRKMCQVARGIAAGIAAHFKERVRIDEPTCMHRGDKRCHIQLSLEGAAARAATQRAEAAKPEAAPAKAAAAPEKAKPAPKAEPKVAPKPEPKPEAKAPPPPAPPPKEEAKPATKADDYFPDAAAGEPNKLTLIVGAAVWIAIIAGVIWYFVG